MVRSFSGRPPEPSVLEEILLVSRRAPAAANTDGWDVVVLEGPAQTAAFWDTTTTADWRGRSRRWEGLSRAPVVLCVFCRPGAYSERYAEADKSGSGLSERDAWPVPYWYVDAGFAVLLMLLAATDKGLGACFLGNFRGEAALRLSLGVPPDRVYFGALLLGEPGGADHRSASLGRERRDPSELFHRGGW